MALSQKLFAKDRLTRGGRWAEKNDYMGMGLVGRTLGLIGAGNIGREIMRLARPFGLRVTGERTRMLTRRPWRPKELSGSDLDTVLRKSDFVVVACLLTPQTHHLIGAAQLRADAAQRLSHQRRARADRRRGRADRGRAGAAHRRRRAGRVRAGTGRSRQPAADDGQRHRHAACPVLDR